MGQVEYSDVKWEKLVSCAEGAVEGSRRARSGRSAQSRRINEVKEEEREHTGYWDNLSGKSLEQGKVRKARQEELGELAKRNVYTRVPVEQCGDRTGRAPIGTRWADVTKGDEKNPDYRSRLVAQEINDKKRECLFAATPPLEAKKILFSLAVTKGIGFGERKRTWAVH